MHKTLCFFGFTLFVTFLPGCTTEKEFLAQVCPAWNDNRSQTDAPAEDTPKRTVDVAACAGGVTQAEIDKTIAIVDLIEDDIYEMGNCALLTRNAAYAVSHYFASLSCGLPLYPSGFTYQGSGYYMVGMVMGLQAKLKKDTSFGKAGDDLTFDVFDSNHYFKSAVIKAELVADASWSTNGDVGAHLVGTLEFTAESPNKPGFELWGIQPEHGKPFLARQEALAKAVGESIEFVSNVDFSPQTTTGSHGTIYTVNMPASIDSIYNGEPMQFDFVSLDAPPTPENQTTSIVETSLAFIPSHVSTPLSGSLTLKVDGGAFPFYVQYAYPKRVRPDVLVTCTAPAPMP